MTETAKARPKHYACIESSFSRAFLKHSWLAGSARPSALENSWLGAQSVFYDTEEYCRPKRGANTVVSYDETNRRANG